MTVGSVLPGAIAELPDLAAPSGIGATGFEQLLAGMATGAEAAEPVPIRVAGGQVTDIEYPRDAGAPADDDDNNAASVDAAVAQILIIASPPPIAAIAVRPTRHRAPADAWLAELPALVPQPITPVASPHPASAGEPFSSSSNVLPAVAEVVPRLKPASAGPVLAELQTAASSALGIATSSPAIATPADRAPLPTFEPAISRQPGGDASPVPATSTHLAAVDKAALPLTASVPVPVVPRPVTPPLQIEPQRLAAAMPEVAGNPRRKQGAPADVIAVPARAQLPACERPTAATLADANLPAPTGQERTPVLPEIRPPQPGSELQRPASRLVDPVQVAPLQIVAVEPGRFAVPTDRLGPVHIVVDAGDARVGVQLTVDSAAAQTMLGSHAPRLADAVASSGSRLDALAVDVRSGGGSGYTPPRHQSETRSAQRAPRPAARAVPTDRFA